MPVHRATITDELTPAQCLAAAIAKIEGGNERVTAVVPSGTEWVIVTERKPGRPPKETRS